MTNPLPHHPSPSCGCPACTGADRGFDAIDHFKHKAAEEGVMSDPIRNYAVACSVCLCKPSLESSKSRSRWLCEGCTTAAKAARSEARNAELLAALEAIAFGTAEKTPAGHRMTNGNIAYMTRKDIHAAARAAIANAEGES